MHLGFYQFAEAGWTLVEGVEPSSPDLILVFGSAEPAVLRGAASALRAGFSEAQIAGCTTGGEAIAGLVSDGGVVAAAVQFTHSHVHAHGVRITSRRESFQAGRRLGQAIAAPALKGVLVLAEGIDCDGSALLAGLTDIVGDELPVFGGLAGDGLDFVVTRVAANGPFESGQAVAIGFYGRALEVGHGTGSGWKRTAYAGAITNSAGSYIYEIDHRPALEVLRQTARLTGSISFRDLMSMPLWIDAPSKADDGLIRTVVGIDEDRGSLIMAGDLPRHGRCSIMSATAADIVAGAREAAERAGGVTGESLILAVSCVGRKLVLGDGTAHEAEAVAAANRGRPLIGFHSYGEFGRQPGQSVRLLNQTMCVTIIGERGS